MEQGRITSSGTISTAAWNPGTATWNPGTVYNSESSIGLGYTDPYQKLTVTSSKMRQVKAALFTVTRDPKTNEIIDSEFVKEFWVKQKSGVSFEVAASFANGYAIDPDTEVIRELLTVNFY